MTKWWRSLTDDQRSLVVYSFAIGFGCMLWLWIFSKAIGWGWL